jgi:cysteinyl-tRNA synthetase, unknown class
MPSRRDVVMTLAGGLMLSVEPSTAHGQTQLRVNPGAARRSQRLGSVKNWGYQLRLLNFAELAASPFDLLVVDHAISNGQKLVRTWRPDEIELLKTKPDGSPRLVFAYISIGEAERYRFYWRPEWFEPATKPRWLGPMNPRWAGNYPVDFWEPEWQRLITGGPDSYVSRIAAQGFDGLYLDRADVFQELAARHPQGARTMAKFIAQLAAEWRQGHPERLVIMQNAEELIAEAPVRAAIDAIAKEDLYHGIDHTEATNTPEQIAASIRDLKRAQNAGKRIFVVEYIGDGAAQARVREQCRRQRFLSYFAPRDLRSIVSDPTSLSASYRGPLVPQENQDLPPQR